MKLGKYTDRPNSFTFLETHQKTERLNSQSWSMANPENNNLGMSMDEKKYSTQDKLKLPALSIPLRKHNSLLTT